MQESKDTAITSPNYGELAALPDLSKLVHKYIHCHCEVSLTPSKNRTSGSPRLCSHTTGWHFNREFVSVLIQTHTRLALIRVVKFSTLSGLS